MNFCETQEEEISSKAKSVLSILCVHRLIRQVVDCSISHVGILIHYTFSVCWTFFKMSTFSSETLNNEIGVEILLKDCCVCVCVWQVIREPIGPRSSGVRAPGSPPGTSLWLNLGRCGHMCRLHNVWVSLHSALIKSWGEELRSFCLTHTHTHTLPHIHMVNGG